MGSDLEDRLKKNRLGQVEGRSVKGRGTLGPGSTIESLEEDFLSGEVVDPTTRKTPPIQKAPGPLKQPPAEKEAVKRAIRTAQDEDRQLQEQDQRPTAPNKTRLQLNHLIFQIPPEQINIQHEIKNVSMGVLRSPSTQKVRTGHGFLQITIPLVFTTHAAVNSELVPLLYMLRKTPYCWTENEYLRKTLMPHNKVDAMMLTLQSITVQSVPNLPTTYQAILQFLWFNYKPYLKDIEFRKWYHMNLKMEPDAFGPEAFNAANPGMRWEGSLDTELTFVPRNRFQEHLDTIVTESDKDKRVVLYDYLQEPVRNPRQSEAWSEFIRGASQNQLTDKEFGPDIAPDKYFRMAWKEFQNFPKGPPKDQTGWELEDPGYAIYSRKHFFSGHNEFIPIHASVQFSHRIASLPLLNQQMPTHQYLGPTDREVTLIFNVTKHGKILLEDFRNHIDRFEQQVVDFRGITKDAYMEIDTPLAKASGIVRGGFGHKVIPESIDMETTPGNPGNTQMRVTFAEFNPSVYEEPVDPYAKEDDILKTFVATVINQLSGGNPSDMFAVKVVKARGDLVADTVGATDWSLNQPEAGIPEIEVELKDKLAWHNATVIAPSFGRQKRGEAQRRGQGQLWEFVDDLCALTQERPFSGQGPGDPEGFAFATDEETYGFKGIVGVDPYWSGDYDNYDALKLKAKQFKENVRTLCRKYLLGELADAFPALSLELTQVNLDLSACYPDMSLPGHPATGRIIDSEPDFYLVDTKIRLESDSSAEGFTYSVIKPSVQRLVTQDSQTAMNDSSNTIDDNLVERESTVYSQSGDVDMDNLPVIDKKHGVEGKLRAQENDIHRNPDGFVGNIGPDEIIAAGIASMKKQNDLGLRKAFPTFRLYFLKEGRDEVDYSNFYQARGGFAVKEIRVIRSRKIPTDTLVVDMVNLDGFLETDDITDIRKDSLQPKQSRYAADNRELFYKYDDQIQSQLQIHNSFHSTKLSFYFVKKLMEGVTDDPAAGEYGPMGTTVVHAELVDGQPHTPDQLADPVTSIRIGTFLLTQIADANRKYEEQARFTEVVAAMYKFPNLYVDIQKAVRQEMEKHGLITNDWWKRVRNKGVEKYAKGVRSQASSESAAQRNFLDQELKKKEDRLKSVKDSNPWLEKVDSSALKEAAKEVKGHSSLGFLRQYILKEPLPVTSKSLDEVEGTFREVKDLEGQISTLKQDIEENWVREPVSKGIIFKEGTDVILKLGYSNNPEKLEVVFVGHVTEAQAGPGTMQIVCQSFVTELLQEVKGVKDGDATLSGAIVFGAGTHPPRVANWIMSMPEVKHFGRWEDAREIIEDQRNIRGVWYKKWNWTNNPSDDNIYIPGRDVPLFLQPRYPFTLNGRTLWQGLMDLTSFFPGFVMSARPYLDLDKKGHRRWRNTLFLGTPDATYLTRVPDNWDKVLFELSKMEDKLDLAFNTAAGDIAGWATQTGLLGVYGSGTDQWAQQRVINERNFTIKEAESLRREPFRRYHMLSSYTDIIDNGIILTKRDVFNGVKLRGRQASLRERTFGDWEERQLSGMDESHIKWLYAENDNSIGDRAPRMATSLLMTALKEIYTGDITILGNPHIQPYDVCFLNDFYNDMSGPFEVEQVIHTFSESTGFITQLVPDLFTSIAETAQRTAIGALSAYSYHYLTEFIGYKWDSTFNNVIRHFVEGTWAQKYLVSDEVDPNLHYLTTTGALATLGAMTYAFPLFMAPVLLAGYFIGGYLRDHAIIRVVPLFHKGIPYVTGLEGFRAPDSGDGILEAYRLLRRSITEGVDAVADLWGFVNDPNKKNLKGLQRTITGW